ncbi:MAG: thioredoxin family protein [Proteobacteria bacterium]|nr:thioredoxin family protein [Pseudomonadota bacterium]
MGLLSSLLGRSPKIQPTSIRSLAEFQDQVVGSELPVIVDVWSPTCAPCKKLVPVMIDLATKHDGKVRVAEIDVAAAEPALVRTLSVQATPTVIIYDAGEEMGRVRGFRPPSWFNQMIEVEFADRGDPS